MLKPTTPGSGIAIGQLAETAGVNVETIRYYQRIGLLSLPKRNYGRIRRYSADDLMRVRFGNIFGATTVTKSRKGP